LGGKLALWAIISAPYLGPAPNRTTFSSSTKGTKHALKIW
jgi:hypothetical protein